MRQFPIAKRATASAVALGILATAVLGGCSVMERLKPGPSGKAPKANAVANAGEIDPRRYIGPDYCPELRIFDGAQLIRTYERGHQGDQNFVTWQASFAKTARECLYDEQGGLALKIGVSGRVVAGPKGDTDPVTVPVKIAIVKNKEGVLATERFTVSVAIPSRGSTVFTEVKNIAVPSPGQDRDYIIYVGFDVGDWDPMHPSGPALAAVEEPPAPPVEEPPPPPPQQAAKPPAPNELPVPTDGFVLSQ